MFVPILEIVITALVFFGLKIVCDVLEHFKVRARQKSYDTRIETPLDARKFLKVNGCTWPYYEFHIIRYQLYQLLDSLEKKRELHKFLVTAAEHASDKGWSVIWELRSDAEELPNVSVFLSKNACKIENMGRHLNGYGDVPPDVENLQDQVHKMDVHKFLDLLQSRASQQRL